MMNLISHFKFSVIFVAIRQSECDDIAVGILNKVLIACWRLYRQAENGRTGGSGNVDGDFSEVLREGYR